MIKCPFCENDVDTELCICSQCGCDLRTTAPVSKELLTADIEKQKQPSIPFQPGQIIDQRYEIREKIGQGGMADVYRVYDRTFEEVIAIKVLKSIYSGNTVIIERFKREISLVRQIKHPSVCRIYNFSTVGDRLYISMEYIEGQTMQQIIHDGSTAAVSFFPAVRRILTGLQVAHSRGVIHRDLKPSNIMIDRTGRPVILDFGIAGRVDLLSLRGGQDVIGTPRYIAPEIMEGKPVDHRSDIYSLGVILAEFFVRGTPVEGDQEDVKTHAENRSDQLRIRSGEQMQPFMKRFISRCLDPNPANRYQTINEMIGVLDSFRREMISHRKNNLILVVDDDESIRDIIATALEFEGYRVAFAANGEQALAVTIEENPALICMDVMMPRMSGLEAVSMLKSLATTNRIPIIVISALGDKAHLDASLAMGVQNYLIKPFSIQDLLSKVRQLVPIMDNDEA